MKRFFTIWGITGIISFVIAAYLFPFVVPLLNLSITMNRNVALEKAALFIESKNFQIPDSKFVAAFIDDNDVQNFVELEGGGKDAFVHMFEENYYHPYRWKVRFFKENTVEENEVYFTPQGTLYSYKHTLSEDFPGAHLSEEKARMLAQEELQAFNIDLQKYALVEHTQQQTPSKRLDHEFTYERTDVSLQEGKYRVRVRVAGDQVIELYQFVKVPERFLRTYQEMRSSNYILHFIGLLFLYGLYLILFGGLIFYHLYKYRLLIYKIPALIAGIISVFSIVLINLNYAPLWNMQYQTHAPYYIFLTTLLVGIFIAGIKVWALLFFTSITGEGITRITQEKQVQLWDVLNVGYLRSTTFVQHIIWAYGLVGIFCLYGALFYWGAIKYLGWWMPASELSDVNILSSYVPWLAPIGLGFFAGFMEELLLRAIPIGCMIWLFPKIKNNWWLFTLVLIAQGIIFGVLHAPYPVLPSYARVLELIPVSCAFGLMYYFVGLIPGIIAHYVYDALLYSIPLFVSDFIVQKGIALFFILLPLLAALYAYARGLIILDPSYLNDAWKPLQESHPIKEKLERSDEYKHMPKMIRYIVLVCGILGIFGAYFYKIAQYDTLPLQISKAEALIRAQHACEQEFNVSLQDWQKLSMADSYKNDMGMNFIWRMYGAEAFRQLQSRYLLEPIWKLRFINFNTDVAHRAEEYKAAVGPEYNSINIEKIVPEIEPGACLSQEQAAIIAYEFLREHYGVSKSDVEFISAQEHDVSHRKDWKLIFKDSINFYNFEKGQGRIEIKIAGDKIVGHHAFVYPGEEWIRLQQAEDMKNNLFSMIMNIFIASLFLCIILQFIWSVFQRKQITNLLWQWGGFTFFISILNIINSIPSLTFSFNTIQPWVHQISQISMLSGISFIITVLGLTGMLGFLQSRYKSNIRYNFLPGIQFGIFLFMIMHMLMHIFPLKKPLTSSFFIHANNYVPGISIFSMYFYIIVCMSILYIGALTIMNKSGGYTWGIIIQLITSLLLGIHIAFIQDIYFLSHIPLIGAIWALVILIGYYLVYRYDVLYVFISFMTICILDCIENIFIPDFPHAYLHCAIASIMLLAACLYILYKINAVSIRK